MKLRVAGKTDRGRLSDRNEDHLLARDDLGLYLVADGVGGLQAAGLASAVACRLIEQSLDPLPSDTQPARHDEVLANAVREANRGLFGYGRSEVGGHGIGTTITALWFHGDRVLFAYVGDSRIYLHRRGVLRQLSRDEKAGQYRLAASLGQERRVGVHIGMVRLERGDRFLLCTDGLYGPLPSRRLTPILDAEDDPAQCCERLVYEANERGGPDNITALVADVVEADPPESWRFSSIRFDATSLPARLCRPWVFAATLAALLAAALLAWAAWR